MVEVMDHVTALAPCVQICIVSVCRVVVTVRTGQGDAGQVVELQIFGRYRQPCLAGRGIDPTTARKGVDEGTVGTAAGLTASSGAREADAVGDRVPIGTIEGFEVRPYGHGVTAGRSPPPPLC